jgi:hypothetical protein
MEEFFERFFEGLMSTYRVDEPYVLTAEETAQVEAKQQVFTELTQGLTFQGALEASNRERELLNTTQDTTLTYGEAVGAT